MSRLNTGVNSTNIPDATLLTITNVTYRDIINVITSSVSENFFYDELTCPTVIGQTEYTFPVRDTVVAGVTQDGLKKLEGVSIKYLSTDEYYTVAKPSTFTSLEYDKAWYAENQNRANPFFIVYDKSVSIFPAPTEEQTMKLYGVVDPKSIISGASESDIKIPLDFHHLIVLGNEYRIYKARRMTSDKNDALAEYKNELQKMVSQLSDRIIRPLESELPYLNHL